VQPKTLLELEGVKREQPRWQDSSLVLIDIQNEYTGGPLRLHGVDAAIESAAKVLAAARKAGAPILHVAHRGDAGGSFDRAAARGAIVDRVTPAAGESVVEKDLPNAFAGTDLSKLLKATGRPSIVVVGFMTHMCVSATVRSALDHGFRSTVVASACATRTLPSPLGGAIEADKLHEASLAALGDLFAAIVADGSAIA
jgi:nicotinamidase-related amidase